MAPTNPWGKQNTSASGFPGLKARQSNQPPPKSHYEELQEDELIALASIYGDDFRQIENKQGAWNVRSHLYSMGFYVQYLSFVLHLDFRITACPKSNGEAMDGDHNSLIFSIEI
jgi:hypothetical protein